LTYAEACKWAARYPHEVELVDGEFWFIAQRTPEGDGGIMKDVAARRLRSALDRDARVLTAFLACGSSCATSARSAARRRPLRATR
jgi:hypothetical protein